MISLLHASRERTAQNISKRPETTVYISKTFKQLPQTTHSFFLEGTATCVKDRTPRGGRGQAAAEHAEMDTQTGREGSAEQETQAGAGYGSVPRTPPRSLIDGLCRH